MVWRMKWFIGEAKEYGPNETLNFVELSGEIYSKIDATFENWKRIISILRYVYSLVRERLVAVNHKSENVDPHIDSNYWVEYHIWESSFVRFTKMHSEFCSNRQFIIIQLNWIFCYIHHIANFQSQYAFKLHNSDIAHRSNDIDSSSSQPANSKFVAQ